MRQLLTGTVTLLFTDIEGSTRLLQRLGNQYAAVLKECRRLLRVAFQQENGFEVDTQGDAFFVVFESATEAVAAAIHAQKALSAAHWPDEAEVRVRMGIHTGEPLPTEEGYVGLDVHYAARIMSAAHGGQVLLSQATRDFVAAELPDGVSLRELGSYRLKDIAGPNQLYQLVIPGLPADFPPLSTLNAQHSAQNIPSPSTSFVGREQEVTTVANLLRRADVRLVTLMGTAGVGKTRLALQVADQLRSLFTDGIYFVPLDQLTSAEAVLPTLAQMLNIQEEKDTPLLEQVKAVLRHQSLLLILDNFEQVIAARRIIADLLTTSLKLKVLVTSRVMLHMQAEHLCEVPPLPLPDRGKAGQQPNLAKLSRNAAIALFVQRAQAVQPDFQLTAANAAALTAICIRLDGIPLAIELAAARIRHFQPQALLTRLEQGLTVLQGRADDVPARQQTLHGAIAWSYDLLTAAEQRVFRRFAVCINGATMEAAERICAGETGADVAEVQDILVALVDQSMLQRQELEKEEVRFWQLQTLREYALACLTEAGELADTQAAHAIYYLSWLEQMAPLLAGAEQVHWLDRLDWDYENVKAALNWLLERARVEAARGEQALQLCNALLGFWELRGYVNEGLTFLERTLVVSQDIAPATRAQVLHGAAFFALIQDDNVRAEAFLRQSQLLFRESGDRAGMANILRLQGTLAMVKSTYKLARRLLEEALALYSERGDTQKVVSTRESLAQIAISQCDYPRAKSLLDENIASYQARGEQYRIAFSLYHLARAYFLLRGDLVESHTLAEECLALFKTAGNRRLMAYTLCILGQIVCMEEYEFNKARVMLEEAVVIFKTLEDRSGTAEALTALARLAVLQGEYEVARGYYSESWKLLQVIGAKDLCAACLEGYGEALLRLGAPQQAVQLWGTAATVRAAIMAPIPPVYRTAYEQAVSFARETLGDQVFQQAWIEGHRKSLEQVELPTGV